MSTEKIKKVGKRALLGGLVALAIGCGHDAGDVEVYPHRYSGLIVKAWGEDACTTYVDIGMDSKLDFAYIDRDDSLDYKTYFEGNEKYPYFAEQFELAKKRYDLSEVYRPIGMNLIGARDFTGDSVLDVMADYGNENYLFVGYKDGSFERSKEKKGTDVRYFLTDYGAPYVWDGQFFKQMPKSANH